MIDLIGRSIDRYHILEQLGRGGMATVYKAFDTRLERDVAVKLIRKEAFGAEVLDRILKRFEREAKALARLSHTNIIQVHDYGIFAGAPYLVMEYLPGGTLKDHLGGPILPSEASRLLLPIAQALAHSHSLGIIHRDIKPSNILIDINGAPKLTDFGIAHILEPGDSPSLTATGTGVGTPEYMAPEQGLGKDVDARTDVYALGVVLYELLTGDKPYKADTPMAVVIKHIHDPVPRPTRIVKTLTLSAERVILKALAKVPENRYENMDAFAAVLAKISSDEDDVSSAGEADITRDEFDLPPDQNEEPNGQNGNVFGDRVGKYLFWVIGFTILLFALILGGIWLGRGIPDIWPPGNPTSTTELPTAIFAETPLPTDTQVPTSTETPDLGIGSMQLSEVDGVVQMYVPAGEFMMGNDDGDNDELPMHMVYLDAYWIDQTEITNAMYAECVVSGVCKQPDNRTPFSDDTYANHPVVYVNWSDAQTYCEWAGRRLPTEAEWEKAARGVMSGRKYPWGDDLPVCQRGKENGAQYSVCEGETVQVKSFAPNDFGLYDMIGNVSEWVADWYDAEFYVNSPVNNPEGAFAGKYKVLRGGAWDTSARQMGISHRFKDIPDYAWGYYGFRCAQSAKITHSEDLRENSEHYHLIQNRGKIYIGVRHGSMYPLAVITGDSYSGFEIDLAVEIVRRLFGDQVDIEWVPIRADERLEAVENGHVDFLIRNTTHTISREERVSFTSTYFLDGVRLLVRRSDGYNSIEDLDGKTVVAEYEFFVAPVENAAMSSSIDIYFQVAGYDDVREMFADKRVDAVTTDWGSHGLYVDMNDYDAHQPLGGLLSSEPLAIAVNLHELDFRDEIDAVLLEIIRDGTWQAFYDHWFPEPPPWTIEEMLNELPVDR